MRMIIEVELPTDSTEWRALDVRVILNEPRALPYVAQVLRAQLKDNPPVTIDVLPANRIEAHK